MKKLVLATMVALGGLSFAQLPAQADSRVFITGDGIVFKHIGPDGDRRDGDWRRGDRRHDDRRDGDRWERDRDHRRDFGDDGDNRREARRDNHDRWERDREHRRHMRRDDDRRYEMSRDDCTTRRTEHWRHNRLVVETTRVCD